MKVRAGVWVVAAWMLSACVGDVDSHEPAEDPTGQIAGAEPDSELNYAFAIDGCAAVTATNLAHRTAGRAYTQATRVLWFSVTTYYAIGSNDRLGTSGAATTLYPNGAGGYSLSAANCQAPRDAGAPVPDAAVPSTPGRDASVRDASVADAGTVAIDGGAQDAGAAPIQTTPDASVVDSGTRAPDSGAPSVPDAGRPVDAGTSSGRHPTQIPSPSATCPDMHEGTVSILGRQVTLWMGTDGESKLGPVVIYWHATRSSPSEVTTGLGSGAVTEIKNLGGIVIAMNAYDGASSGGSSTGNNVWFVGDLSVTDEAIACAIQQRVGIDTSRIHTLGFSAGGLQASYMLKARSNYIASATSYSGGAAFPVQYQDPSNKLPVILFYGGASDTFGISFETASINMANDLKSAGHFVIMSNHNGGHRIPTEGAATSWQFFKDHSYERTPEPYASLPASFPSYCSIF